MATTNTNEAKLAFHRLQLESAASEAGRALVAFDNGGSPVGDELREDLDLETYDAATAQVNYHRSQLLYLEAQAKAEGPKAKG